MTTDSSATLRETPQVNETTAGFVLRHKSARFICGGVFAP